MRTRKDSSYKKSRIMRREERQKYKFEASLIDTEFKHRQYAEIKRQKREAEWLNVQPVFSFFRIFADGKLEVNAIDDIISSFPAPPAKFSAIVRIGRKLEERGVDSEPWIEEANARFL